MIRIRGSIPMRIQILVWVPTTDPGQVYTRVSMGFVSKYSKNSKLLHRNLDLLQRDPVPRVITCVLFPAFWMGTSKFQSFVFYHHIPLPIPLPILRASSLPLSFFFLLLLHHPSHPCPLLTSSNNGSNLLK